MGYAKENDDYDDQSGYESGGELEELSEYAESQDAESEQKFEPNQKKQEFEEDVKQLQQSQSEEETAQEMPFYDQVPERAKQLFDQDQLFLDDEQKPNEIRITTPYITKYEKAMIIGKRAKQISQNSPIYVSISTLQLSRLTTFDIVEKEYQEKKIPMIIRRYLPDGSFEDWKLSQLKSFEF